MLWYGGYLVFHGSINPGTLISLMLYTLNLAMCFAFLANVYGEFMQVLYINYFHASTQELMSAAKHTTVVYLYFGCCTSNYVHLTLVVQTM